MLGLFNVFIFTPGLFRLFLAMVVVVHHSFPLRLGGWAVGMFFALSGYWIARMWDAKYAKEQDPLRSFLVSRWWRVAPLFVFVQAIAAWLVFAGFSIGNSSAAFNWKWWVTQPLVVGSVQADRLLPPSWSLDVEMQFYLIAPVLLLGIAQLTGRSGVYLAVLLTAWGTIRLLTGATLETASLDVFLWLFLAGILKHRLQVTLSRRLILVSTGCLCLLLTVVYLIPASTGLIWKRGADGPSESNGLHAMFFIATCLLGLPLALGTTQQKSDQFDRWLGDLSYPLYLFHWLPRDWYYSQLDLTAPAWRSGGLLVANFALAIVGAVVLLVAVDRPIQNWRRRGDAANLVNAKKVGRS